ncbi:hypothetical protein [Streptomyces sp. NPDC101234]|uniref:hypothetical protein n=1 Tax=Streptomyces sp. NPDC101234 TaxID=3366138 RepID=UPI00380FAE87
MEGSDLEGMLGSLLGRHGEDGQDGRRAGHLPTLIGAMSHGRGGGSVGPFLETLARSARARRQPR